MLRKFFRRAEPSLHILAAAVVVDAFVLPERAFSHSDVDGLTGTGEERNCMEGNVSVCSIEYLLHRVAGKELLAECAVGGDAHHQHCASVVLEDIFVGTFHRGEAELLCIISFDASFQSDGVCLEPVVGHCPRICFGEFLNCRGIRYLHFVVDGMRAN